MSDSDNNVEFLQSRIVELERLNHGLSQQLEQVEMERTEYLQNVSHQLVAPLNAIKWHIENITDARIGVDRAKKVLRSIYSQATLAVHLAKNFNLMSNLEADHALTKLKEPLQNIRLLKLLINLADDFQPLAWDQNIQVKVIDDGLDEAPDILAMKPLVSQVFSNIIENAVKYSDRDTEIIIEGEYLPNSDSVVVAVRNRGIPLPTENTQSLFDRGVRSDGATSKYPAGTGFGLYIARRIVEIHEGAIHASSCKGWNIFEVTLSVKGLKGKARIRD